MRKVWLVIKREYITHVRTKGFIITTILIPALLIGFIAFDVGISAGNSSQTLRIAIVDNAGGLAQAISGSLGQINLPHGQPAYSVAQIVERPADPEATRAALEARVRRGRLDGFLWLPPAILSGAKPRFVTGRATVFMDMGDINGAVSDALIVRRFERRGISTRHLDQLIHHVDVRVIRLTKHGETEEQGHALFVAIAMVAILYGALLAYGHQTMRSIQEEKSSRVMEILLSSIQPVQLLAGKILGVAAVGLTQFIIWAIAAGLLAAYGLTVARTFRSSASHFSIHIPPVLLVFLVVYFVGGYLLYASFYAAIGATVSSEQDAHQLSMPVTLLLVAAFILFEVVMQNPNSPASIVLSIIPFFSPLLMIMRMALEMPPIWQIAVSLAVLVLSVLGVVYASARIYRVGVLMYGKRPSLAELVRWFRYS